MLVIEGKTAKKITVSFSSSVGREGLKSIKRYVEMIEKSPKSKPQKVSKAAIKKIADEIAQAGWEKMKKAHNL
jgi:hypothetical protein